MPIEAVHDFWVRCTDHISDKCYRQQLLEHTTHLDALNELERQGWHIGTMVNYCPECWLTKKPSLLLAPNVSDMPTMSYVNSIVSSSPPTGDGHG